MGEDRTTCVEKKPNDVIAPPCRHRHSSVISSCSEDAESESTSTGYPQSPDEEREEELEYGPGIVNKLRTRFLSITLKQNRGINMRRSCSMENLLDQDRPFNPKEKTMGMVNGNCAQIHPAWGNLKKAKSMDSLLAELQPESSVKDLRLDTHGEDSKKIPKIVKNLERGLNRLCDEELPKPDTVKTYKRMFEPAESRRGSHCRRPPVLRASAKSCAASKINGIATNTSAKVNGVTTKSKYSAKQSPPVKAQSSPESAPAINGNVNKPVVNGEPSRPLYNGCHIVKANPVKINNIALRNGKDMEKNLNSINRLLNKKEVHFVPKTDVIINGNGCHNEILKIKTNDEIVKQFTKPTPNNVILNGSTKPKVPSNRPSLKSPKPLLKYDDQKLNDKVSPPKLKPKLVNGLKKSLEADQKVAPVIPVREVVKTVPENKTKMETKPSENKLEEFKTPSDDKSKDDIKPEPENNISSDIKSTVESNLKIETNKPLEETNKSCQQDTESKTVECPKPKAREIPKPSERTVPSDFKNLNYKPQKAPAPILPLKNPENGHLSETDNSNSSKPELVQDTEVKREFKPVKKQKSPAQTTSIVFDFRGKDVVPHVAVLPVPFGCKSLHPKKRPVIVDGKEVTNGTASDDEDEEFVDYSVPPPSGVVFEGENVKIGRGSILSTRNKDLKITFDDDVDSNTFVYPSENSLLEEPDRSLSPTTSGNEIIPNGQPPPPTPLKLKTNTSIGNSSAGGLSTYTPSVLRTVDNFEPGMFRPSSAPPEKEGEHSEEEENKERKPLKFLVEDHGTM
ncbi:uncharacterized protein TNCT_256921 [Trichonephila clavata]|uniref:Uncharacterized protein n=1 Tax=Trichonephila clavata TaxID=2740835 RepID=A0A8X6FVW2_TRICU|nr:uncharacterized protein TNCT_256921 [Trichonephila clavata]